MATNLDNRQLFNEYVTNAGNGNFERWGEWGFKIEDFKLLDLNSDLQIDENEALFNGIKLSTFQNIAGSDNVITKNEADNEWDYLVTITTPHKNGKAETNWSKGAFDVDDFGQINRNKDNTITFDEWKRNDLSKELFAQIAGVKTGAVSSETTFNEEDWGYFLQNQPKRSDWNEGDFKNGDYDKLKYQYEGRDKFAGILNKDWLRNGLPEKLFNQLCGEDGQISPGEWKYFTETTLGETNWYDSNTSERNYDRWVENRFVEHSDTMSDFKQLDYDKDGKLQIEDWTRNGLKEKLFNQLAVTNPEDKKEITSKEWNYFLNYTLTRAEDWRDNKFNTKDFDNLNYSHNQVNIGFTKVPYISARDWERNGLSVTLWNQLMSSPDEIKTGNPAIDLILPRFATEDAIYRRDWDNFCNITQTKIDRWTSLDFTAEDFYGKDGSPGPLNLSDNKNEADYNKPYVTYSDWKRHFGLANKSLFTQIAGSIQETITSGEWDYLLDVTLKKNDNDGVRNFDRWCEGNFNTEDFMRITTGDSPVNFLKRNPNTGLKSPVITEAAWKRNGLGAVLFTQLSDSGVINSIEIQADMQILYDAANTDKYNGKYNFFNEYNELKDPSKYKDTEGNKKNTELTLQEGIPLADITNSPLSDKTKHLLLQAYSETPGMISLSGKVSTYAITYKDGAINQAGINDLKKSDVKALFISDDPADDPAKANFLSFKSNVSLDDIKNSSASQGTKNILERAYLKGWNYLLNVTQKNYVAWNDDSAFKYSDFALFDYSGGGTITEDEWTRSGLDPKLFRMTAGWYGKSSAEGHYIDKELEWAYLTDVVVPNIERWKEYNFDNKEFDLPNKDFDLLNFGAMVPASSLNNQLTSKLLGLAHPAAIILHGYSLEPIKGPDGVHLYILHVDSNLKTDEEKVNKIMNSTVLSDESKALLLKAYKTLEGDPVISVGEWWRANLPQVVPIFNNLAGKSEVENENATINRDEWEHFIDKTLPNHDRWWNEEKFTDDDFDKIDRDPNIKEKDGKDGVIDLTENWQRHNLPNNLYKRIFYNNNVDVKV